MLFCAELGKQAFVNAVLALLNCKLPFELAFTAENVCLYNETGNGKTMLVTKSSAWLPISVVPGTIETPVEVVKTYV